MKDPAIKKPISITKSIGAVYHPQTGQKAIIDETKQMHPMSDEAGMSFGAITSISSMLGTIKDAYTVIDENIPKVISAIEKNRVLTLLLSQITQKKLE